MSDTWTFSLPSADRKWCDSPERRAFGEGNLDDKQILDTRKTLLDLVVEDKKIIKSKSEKLKTLETFKRIWEAQDGNSLRKETFKLLGKSTLTLSK